MVKLTKIYTKTGDTGTTGLAGKHRVNKRSEIIRLIGSLDELNANIGYSIALMTDQVNFHPVVTMCQSIQNHLFNIGADICSVDKSASQPTAIRQRDIEILESGIDAMNKTLQPLKSFILPGGHPIAAHMHITRAVCRRCELDYWQWLETQAEQPDSNITYINRLSDWLFTCCRWLNDQTKVTEPLWQPSYQATEKPVA